MYFTCISHVFHISGDKSERNWWRLISVGAVATSDSYCWDGVAQLQGWKVGNYIELFLELEELER